MSFMTGKGPERCSRQDSGRRADLRGKKNRVSQAVGELGRGEICPCSHLGGGDPHPADGGSHGHLHPGQSRERFRPAPAAVETGQISPAWCSAPSGYCSQTAVRNHPVPGTVGPSEGPLVSKDL